MARPKGSKKARCKCGAVQFGKPGTSRTCHSCEKRVVVFVRPAAKVTTKAKKGKRR